MPNPQSDSAETRRLLQSIEEGDRAAFDALFERHRATLATLVGQRLSNRLRRRADVADVLQEAEVDAFTRIDDYLVRRPMPFRLWLIKTTHQRLLKIERSHLQTAKRSVECELPLPDRSSMALAATLVSNNPSPSDAANRKEMAQKVRRLLAQLDEKDREIIMLRNFAGLSNSEASSLLEIQPEAAKKRYTRALLRLRQLFEDLGVNDSSM